MNEYMNSFVSLFITFFILVNISAFARSKYDLVKQVRFERGKSGTTITGVLIYGPKHFYRLEARKGQAMSVKMIVANKEDEGDIGFTIDSLHHLPGRDTRILDGIDPRGGNDEWSGELPVTGEYEIVVHNRLDQASHHRLTTPHARVEKFDSFPGRRRNSAWLLRRATFRRKYLSGEPNSRASERGEGAATRSGTY
jgi:hypothetical protein